MNEQWLKDQIALLWEKVEELQREVEQLRSDHNSHLVFEHGGDDE